MIVNAYFRVLDGNTMPILSYLRTIRHPNIKIWVSQNDARDDIITNMRDVIFVEKNCNPDNSLSYFSWHIDSHTISVNSCGLKCLIWRKEQNSTDFVIIDNAPIYNNRHIFFIDAIHKEEYPKDFYKIPCYSNVEDFIQYCDINNVFEFSLKDTKRFMKATNVDPINGAVVYKEITTNRYWYLDTFHKSNPHYEVFDSTGKIHIGEASIDGKIDTSTKDNTKEINVK